MARTYSNPVHRKGRRPFLACLVILSSCHLVILPFGCHARAPISPTADSAGSPWFVDITDEVGLDFVHEAGPVGSYFIPQIMGSGAALIDFDNDGRLDIYLVQNGGPLSGATNRLFHQEPDGRFKDVSAGSGLDIAGYGMGVAVGDVNNDGWPDVLVTEYGRTRLFLNKGNGTFADITSEAGLDNLLWGTSACLVDYDRDGWLDLVVVNYVDYDPSRRCSDQGGRPDYCHPNAFPGTTTKIFRNLGPGDGRAQSAERGAPVLALRTPLSALPVRFKDVTLESGLGRRVGNGLGVVCADFNGDHWSDIFIAEDAQPNQLWINRHDGTFSEEAVARGVAYNGLGRTQGNMGIALGDVNGDGFLDLFVSHLTEETHTLWQQAPRGQFRDRTAAAGLGNPRWHGTGFGTVLADFDHDGALDLAVVDGRVARAKLASPEANVVAALGPYWSRYAERNQLFANDGAGHFRDLSCLNQPFCAEAGVYRGLACGDIDGDGALDLLVTSVAGRARLYRNVAPRRGHWLLVRALGQRRDAYGAEITVVAGPRRWLRSVNPGYSYLCSNDPRAHFGLGDAERVDAIEVIWPDGTKEAFSGGPTDRQVVLRKGESKR